jgi:hypothetical protein
MAIPPGLKRFNTTTEGSVYGKNRRKASAAAESTPEV